ncbi:MAG: hypothetical protein FWE08_03360 [Oscillospiraceae bacterium]|nr:hypothetical protein [Oscillospiraceae bacterium]
MTNFTTITEKEILTMVWDTLTEKKLREYDRIEAFAQEGKEAPIARQRFKKYDAQSNEIRARILEIENAK